MAVAMALVASATVEAVVEVVSVATATAAQAWAAAAMVATETAEWEVEAVVGDMAVVMAPAASVMAVEVAKGATAAAHRPCARERIRGLVQRRRLVSSKTLGTLF